MYTESSGSILDASGPLSFDNDANCEWIIAPSVPLNLTVTIEWMDTERDKDTISVYECNDPECKSKNLKRIVSGTGSNSFSTSKGYMLVHYQSDSSQQSDGFGLRWYQTNQTMSVSNKTNQTTPKPKPTWTPSPSAARWSPLVSCLDYNCCKHCACTVSAFFCCRYTAHGDFVVTG